MQTKVILKKASRKQEEQSIELEGIIIGQYYYCLYYEIIDSELNHDKHSGYWVSVYPENIYLISVNRCRIEDETEYSPVYELDSSLFQELKKECANHGETYYQDELIENHKINENEYKYSD